MKPGPSLLAAMLAATMTSMSSSASVNWDNAMLVGELRPHDDPVLAPETTAPTTFNSGSLANPEP